MVWLNVYGLAVMLLLMLPNILFSLRHKEAFADRFSCKRLETAEQIGRYGSFLFMLLNIPYTYVGWLFRDAKLVYLIVNGALLFAYELLWVILRKKNNLTRAILLSVIPSVIFVFSGVMQMSIPLVLFSLLFAVCHITISVRNADITDASPKKKRNGVITAVALLMALLLLAGAAYGAVLFKSIVPFINAAQMTAEEMLEYDVKSKGTVISLAVIRDGAVTYSTYGASAEDGTLYDYEIGSLSKTFLGLLFSKLVSENRVSLDDSIADYLQLGEDTYYPTIRRLLTHTSGYESYYFEAPVILSKLSGATANDFYGISKEQLLRRIKKTQLADRDYPFCYSNFGIAALGLVLEAIEQRSFADIMNDFIRDELGLSNTAVAKQSGNLNNYWKWKTDDAYLPAGAIISDIHDMSEYLRLCLSSGGYIESSFDTVQTVDANNPTYLNYGIRIDTVGMTWMRDDENGYIWHNGATTAYNSYFAFDRECGVGVVLLGNLNASDRITLTVIGARLMHELTEGA